MMASEVLTRIQEAAAFLQTRVSLKPSIGVILGTGLGDFTGALDTRAIVPYREIPEFPVSTVESHAGELHFGLLADFPIAVMKGRVHYYEGYTMQQVAFPIRVLKAIGCETLLITNACGSMNPDMPAGTIVVTTDHINLMGDNPLIGPNDDELGPRFPDMSEPYARELVALADDAARGLGLALPHAVFVAVTGPNLETAAEYRFLRWIGADVVGMSLVPETIAAVHGRQRVLALNVVTDECLPDHLRPVDVAEILRIAGTAAPQLIRLMTEIIRRLGAPASKTV
jgi:purine-nucleoside phosphorylase